MPGRGEMSTEGVDERRLAHSGHTSDSHSMAPTGVREQPREERLGELLMIGSFRLDESDGPTESSAISSENSRLVGVEVDRLSHDDRVRPVRRNAARVLP